MVEKRKPELYGALLGLLISALLGVLSGLNLFSPYSCPLQGAIGLLAGVGIIVLSGPALLRRIGGVTRGDYIKYVIMGLLMILAAWPVFHTTILLLKAH